MSAELTGPLADLAAMAGVATRYSDYRKRPVDVGDHSVRRVLAAMGIAADDDDAAAASLEALRGERSRRHLPPSLMVRRGQDGDLAVGDDVRTAVVTLEDGAVAPLPVHDGAVRLATIPTGYHRLEVHGAAGSAATHLVVAPPHCPLPLRRRSFGWMAQLYAVRSRESWGIGDYGDLATLAGWSGDVGAAMILVNPLHAPAPVMPQENSPYSPTSRRYRSPLYLRIEDVPELQTLPPAQRADVLALAEPCRDASVAARIDRDRVFRAKSQALEILAGARRSPTREAEFRRWVTDEGTGLVDFATFCVLAERHGVPWQEWPAALRHPTRPEVATARAELHDRVMFHMWLQWLCDRQLADAQDAARTAGMDLGIVHDLAVGVDPGGADAWALQDELATGVTVGAPPDGFNQRGQDWGLPPLLPHRLAETGFTVFRDMLRGVLRHAGGIRIDHIMGLWRLWWVPNDGGAADGTYVRYPVEDLLGVLALEAERAGAMVVGEDLGTVESGVRETLAQQRILSSRVLYFERVDDDADQPMLPASEYPELALTSISTHDLPTAAGWWADEDVRIRSELQLFGAATTPEREAERKAAERADMLDLLRGEGLLDDNPTPQDLLVAMHAFLALTPSILVATGLHDVVGDLRQPNLPGTTDEYPNWRLPLARPADGTHEPLWLEELVTAGDVAALAALLRRRPSQ